jgi:hypothetical protein
MLGGLKLTSILNKIAHQAEHRLGPEPDGIPKESDEHRGIRMRPVDDALNIRQVGILRIGVDGRDECVGEVGERDATENLVMVQQGDAGTGIRISPCARSS